jgi:hypothetical protein
MSQLQLGLTASPPHFLRAILLASPAYYIRKVVIFPFPPLSIRGQNCYLEKELIHSLLPLKSHPTQKQKGVGGGPASAR